MALQEKTPELVLGLGGISMKPDVLYSFLVDAIASSSKLRIVSEDKKALKGRFAWKRNAGSEYHFDFAISSEGNLCDLHFLPVSPADKMLDHAVATVIGAISSYEELRVIEANGSTFLTNEPSSIDLEKITFYLEEQGLLTLEQISDALGISQLTVDIGLHRLIDDGVVGCTPPGYAPNRFYFHK